MPKFQPILDRALARKNGQQGLDALISEPLPALRFLEQTDDRFLAMMTKVVFQAGFVWRVIDNKWADFETVFFGFDPEKMILLSPEQLAGFAKDTRIVRNLQKIMTVPHNADYILQQSRLHGSYGAFLQQWPKHDLAGLYRHLKQSGSRLGGMSGPRMLRSMGMDAYLLTSDVVVCLQGAGLDIASQPSNKSDVAKVQNCFNQWQDETGFSFNRLSRICACSVGENYTPK